MPTLTSTLGRTGFATPRLTWRRALARLFALDALVRERDDLAALDDHMLRDIGVTRADIDGVLSRPEAHLRLILRRGGDQFEH